MRPPVLLDLPDAITTDRLVLRSPVAGDGPAVNAAILETWEVLHGTMPWARERPTVDDTEQHMRQARASYLLRTDLTMLIVRRDGDIVLGSTGLHRMDWAVPRFEIGYWVRRSHEGQGYVTEAATALARFALRTLGAARVEIHTSHRNRRSQRVAERCGFVLEARIRNHGREVNGELRDTMIYSLTPSDPTAQALVAP